MRNSKRIGSRLAVVGLVILGLISTTLASGANAGVESDETVDSFASVLEAWGAAPAMELDAALGATRSLATSVATRLGVYPVTTSSKVAGGSTMSMAARAPTGVALSRGRFASIANEGSLGSNA